MAQWLFLFIVTPLFPALRSKGRLQMSAGIWALPGGRLPGGLRLPYQPYFPPASSLRGEPEELDPLLCLSSLCPAGFLSPVTSSRLSLVSNLAKSPIAQVKTSSEGLPLSPPHSLGKILLCF